MGQLALIILALFQHAVVIHTLSCPHTACARPKYCELTVDAANQVHGDCVTLAVHRSHHYPPCNTATAMASGEHCYCNVQSCVDRTIKAVRLGDSALVCKGSLCDPTSEYCELLTNSKGVHGSCVPRRSALHETACTKTVSREPCVCHSQTCIDAMINSYTEAPHLNCHGTKCIMGERCILSSINRRHAVCASGNNVPACSTQTATNGSQCSCDNQQCIYNFILTTNMIDDHVDCGTSRCHVHSGQVCQLENVGTTHHFGVNTHPHVQLHCVSNKQHSNICTSFPQVNKLCNCVNQVCVESFSNACDDAENKALCDRYEGSSHMCESSSPNLLSLAEGRCSQYCKSCVAGTGFAVTTTVPTTQVSGHNACTHVHNYQQCNGYSKTYNLCESTNSFLKNIASGRCAEYCKICYERSTTPTTTEVTTTPTTTEAPTTKATTPEITTTSLPTTPREYPICVGKQCDKYFPNCNLFDVNTYIEGRCVPFKVGSTCVSVNDLLGSGCTCSDTSCSLNILTLHANHVTHPSTTTTIAVTTVTKPSTIDITTEPQEYECLGNICSSSMKFCHIYSYNGELEGRCMPFSAWPVCHQKTDFQKAGCECTSSECVTFMKTVEILATVNTPVPTYPSTQRSMRTTDELTTTTPNIATTEETIKIFTTTQNVEPSSTTTTEKPEITTTKELCQDRPGVDCLLLNTTNICANPFSHQYCAAFCGHCLPKAINVGFG